MRIALRLGSTELRTVQSATTFWKGHTKNSCANRVQNKPAPQPAFHSLAPWETLAQLKHLNEWPSTVQSVLTHDPNNQAAADTHLPTCLSFLETTLRGTLSTYASSEEGKGFCELRNTVKSLNRWEHITKTRYYARLLRREGVSDAKSWIPGKGRWCLCGYVSETSWVHYGWHSYLIN